MNDENLIQNSGRSRDEVEKANKRGGVASGIARRKKSRRNRSIQELVGGFMDMKIKSFPQFKAVAEKVGLGGECAIKELYVVVCSMNALKKGRFEDLKLLQELLGEQAEHDENVTSEISALARSLFADGTDEKAKGSADGQQGAN